MKFRQVFGLFKNVWSNPNGRLIYWRFLKENWRQLLTSFESLLTTRMFNGLKNFESYYDYEVAPFFPYCHLFWSGKRSNLPPPSSSVS
ncbi:hypothetical protein ElyMa_002276100 [Elysia marginata]|uniref:Uncharacterized protein n=1 Tax=Elysia marginata TaxID=1093978 RepID=A0AAV4G1S9_9GAST|nr:hypothetical protein ElyMa_002276100 [Elysia marginata]